MGLKFVDKHFKSNEECLEELNLSIDEYRMIIKNLRFLENKEEMLEKEVIIKHGIFILLGAIEEDHYPYLIDEYGFVLIIKLPNGKNKIVYHADYGLDSSTLKRIFEDKIYTSKILKQYGIKVAKDMLVITENSIYSNNRNNLVASKVFGKKVGYPLIFKPNKGSSGKGVQKIFSEEELIQAISDYNQKDSEGLYLLQEYFPGKDYRVIYLNGEILGAYERIPPFVLGDGKSSLQTLLIEKDFHTNPKILNFLSKMYPDFGVIPPKDKEIFLLPTANIATGGSVRIVEPTEKDRAYLEKIANVFGANYFGIDIISEGALCDGIVLEINKSPITKGIYTASETFRENYPQKIRKEIKKRESI